LIPQGDFDVFIAGASWGELLFALTGWSCVDWGRKKIVIAKHLY